MCGWFGVTNQDEPNITEVEHMHDTNAAAWRAMIKAVANAELQTVAVDKGYRKIQLGLNNGRTFEISRIPTNVNIDSLAIALKYMFNKLEAFPMAMEVKEL